MANYLPVLLVSVAAGVPDDAALQPLPRGQVDYLSHEWEEDDVARSWRSMTKQKNEIANGLRLENASWRTWWKQRNKLKTVSPETLNWLKDSDVTWLYGPLHTADDWAPPKPPASSTPSPASGSPPKSDSPRGKSMKKSLTTTSLSSPSSSIALDRYNRSTDTSAHVQSYRITTERGTAMKPILKHRSISEMLTSALPPSPFFSHYAAREPSGGREDDNAFDEIEEDVDESGNDSPRSRRATFAGAGGRPPMFHTKSDTNILPRFGAGKRMHRVSSSSSPPRVAPSAIALDLVHEHPLEDEERPPISPTSSHGGSSMFTASQRIGAVGNLMDLPYTGGVPAASTSSVVVAAAPSPGQAASVGAVSAPPMSTRSGSGSGSSSGSSTYKWSGSVTAESGPTIAIPSEVGQDGRSDTNTSISSNITDELSPTYSSSSNNNYSYHGSGAVQQPFPPQKKHISFNAIVEQCIAIDGGTPDAVDADIDLDLTHDQGADDDLKDMDAEQGVLGMRLMKRGWTDNDGENGYDEDGEDGMYEDVDRNHHVESEFDSHAPAHSSRGYEWDAQDEMRRSHQANSDSRAGRIYGRPRIQDDDDEEEDDDDDEEVLEIRTPSRRNSSSSLNSGASQKAVEFSSSLSAYGLEPSVFDSTAPTIYSVSSGNVNGSIRPSRADQPKRPRFRSTSTNKSKKSITLSGSGSGSGSGSTSNSRSRSGGGHGGVGYGGGADREHVTIAPIAPTMLKAEAGSSGDGEDTFAFAPSGMGSAGYAAGHGGYDPYGEEGVLYAGGMPVTGAYSSSNSIGAEGVGYAFGNSPYNSLPASATGPGHASGYGYGGYGFGEHVSVGRDVVCEGFEHGPLHGGSSGLSSMATQQVPTSSTRGEPGELVYQASDGSVHPWSEQEAIRFRTQLEFGASSPAGASPVSGSPPVRGGQIVVPPGMGRGYANGVLGVPVVASPAVMGEEREYFGVRAEDREPQGARAEEGQNVRIVLGADSMGGRSSPPEQSRDISQSPSQLQVYTAESIKRERNRTPSPDYLGVPPTHPRLATLRSESSHGSPSISVPPSESATTVTSAPQSPPTLTIPVPAQSPGPAQDADSAFPHSIHCSPSVSPTKQNLLSPPDVSPGRGRSTCTSPISVSVSGSTTSAPSTTSSSSFDARSISDSRSDSRGRSRTRNSSLSASSDMEPERGRSRSRSTNCSAAASPLSDSSSPHTRLLPTSGASTNGVTLGGGVGHSGREIRDGRGVRLYRKTSEDYIARAEERGRSSESRHVRLSESLSPPTIGSGNANAESNGEAKVYGGYYRPPSSSGLQTGNAETNSSTESTRPNVSVQGKLSRTGASVKLASSHSDSAIAGNAKATLVDSASGTNNTRSGHGSRSTPIKYRHRNSGHDERNSVGLEVSSVGSGSASGSYSGSSTMTDGRTLPPSIPEEDEQLLRSRNQTPVSTPVTALAPVLPAPRSQMTMPPIPSIPVSTAETTPEAYNFTPNASSNARHARTPSIGMTSPPPRPKSSEVPLPSITRVVKASSSSASSPAVTVDAQGTGTFANRAADIMSSARTLLGTIWSGTTA